MYAKSKSKHRGWNLDQIVKDFRHQKSWHTGQLTPVRPLWTSHKTSFCNVTFNFWKYNRAISSTVPSDGCFITLVMGERAGSRGTEWNFEHDPSPARTQGRDTFRKKRSFAMREVDCLASISCGSKLPPERDIFYENMHSDFSKLLPAPLWQKGQFLTVWDFNKI